MNEENRSEEKFADEAKTLFDASVDKLDAATLSVLNQSRQRALEERRTPRTAWLRWASAATVASGALVVFMATLPDSEKFELIPASVSDVEIVLGEDSIEMLEDLEFYSWLDAVDENDDTG